MAEGHCFKANGRPRLCRARVDRIRVDLAWFTKPSWMAAICIPVED